MGKADGFHNGLHGGSSISGGKYFLTEKSNAVTPASHYGKDPTNFATDWLKLVTGDGAHLREHR